MSTFPVYLTHLEEQGALVIGTGPTAPRKIDALIEAEASVSVLDPAPSAPVRRRIEEGDINWIDRAYRPGDLEGVALVIVTECDSETKQRVWEEAQARNVLVNTTGDPARSTFSNGATLRRGPLVVSVSTSGTAPALSVRLKEQLEADFGPEYEQFLTIMKRLRDPMQQCISDFDDRRERWYTLVDSDVLDLLRQGQSKEAWARIESIVGPRVMRELKDEEEGCLTG